MNRKVLTTLEFNKIIDRLASYASSYSGKAKVRALLPIDNQFEIDIAQQNTEDALGRILRLGRISFQADSNLAEVILRLRKDSTLTTGELLSVAKLLENVLRTKSYGSEDDEHTDSLSDYFIALAPLSPVCKEIRRCILAEDEIADDASSELKSIRHKMKTINDRIHTQLSKMVTDTYRSYLQDGVITQRDGRYCIPVKAEYKSSVPGMIHDQSATASTFFIEPAAVVSLNNDLRQLEIQEEHEIQVILSKLSVMCGEHVDEIASNLEIISTLDFIFAKGNLALEMNATRPVHNTEHIIRLKKARHPLLDSSKAVPIDVCLGDDYDLLIVTGPNTGGKTVSLKTIGLLTLMGQAGLHIPASDHSELSIFNEVYADIGDEQSIEQSLSTFSSHMKTIVNILACADANSLCLFDELGAGTDPTEGAALAIAILSKLHGAGIRTMATTHYSELKIFALREPYVENACCEFDVESLRPTYRLLTGIPGKSNAFAISSKLGLSNDIIEDAKTHLTTKDTSFEDVISRLETDRRTMEEDKLQIARYKHDIEVLKETYEQRKGKLDEAKETILEEARAQAREILKEAKDTADETIRDLQKYGSGGNMKQLEKSRTKLRQSLDKNASSMGLAANNKTAKSANKPSDFKLGESVRIISMNLEGTVHTLPDKSGNLFVQCGIMRMQSNINDLEILMTADITGPHTHSSKKSSTSTTSGFSKASSISAELNLLGLTADEAIAKLDKYLDDAYMSHLSTVRIVHGKGTGVLRKAVNNHLKRVSYVKSFSQAQYGEGDAGVTVVEFK